MIESIENDIFGCFLSSAEVWLAAWAVLMQSVSFELAAEGDICR